MELNQIKYVIQKENLEKAVKLHNTAENFYRLAFFYEENEQVLDAEKNYSLAIYKDLTHYQSLINLSILYLKKRKWEEAETLLNDARAIKTVNADIEKFYEIKNRLKEK